MHVEIYEDYAAHVEDHENMLSKGIAPSRRWVPAVAASHCTGCGRCVAACRWHLLSLEPSGWVKSAVIRDIETCTGCKKCEVVCPFNAITQEEPIDGSSGC